MPRIKEYRSRFDSGTSFVSPRRATAEDFGAGVGRALESKGKQTFNIGLEIQNRQDTTESLEAQTALQEQQTRAIIDFKTDPGELSTVTDRFMQQFDDNAQKTLNSLSSNGKSKIQSSVAGFRNNLLTSIATFQASKTLERGKSALSASIASTQSQVQSRQLLLPVAKLNIEQAVANSVNSKILTPQEGKERLRIEIESLQESNIVAIADDDPAGFIQALNAGTFDDVSTKTRNRLKKFAQKKILDEANTLRLERIVEGLTNNKELRDKRNQGALTATDVQNEISTAASELKAAQLSGDKEDIRTAKIKMDLADQLAFEIGLEEPKTAEKQKKKATIQDKREAKDQFQKRFKDIKKKTSVSEIFDYLEDISKSRDSGALTASEYENLTDGIQKKLINQEGKKKLGFLGTIKGTDDEFDKGFSILAAEAKVFKGRGDDITEKEARVAMINTFMNLVSLDEQNLDAVREDPQKFDERVSALANQAKELFMSTKINPRTLEILRDNPTASLFRSEDGVTIDIRTLKGGILGQTVVEPDKKP